MACITESKDTNAFAAKPQPLPLRAPRKARFLSDILTSSYDDDDLIDDLCEMAARSVKNQVTKAKPQRATKKQAARNAAAAAGSTSCPATDSAEDARAKAAKLLAPIDFGYDVDPYDAKATTSYTIYLDEYDAVTSSNGQNVSFKELEEVAGIAKLKDETPTHRMLMRQKRLANLMNAKDNKPCKRGKNSKAKLSLFALDSTHTNASGTTLVPTFPTKHVSLLGAALYAPQYFELPAMSSPSSVPTARASNKTKSLVRAEACLKLYKRMDKITKSHTDEYDYVFKADELALCPMNCVYAVRFEGWTVATGMAQSTLVSTSTTAQVGSDSLATSLVGCASSESLNIERYTLDYAVVDDFAIRCNDFTLAQTATISYTALPIHDREACSLSTDACACTGTAAAISATTATAAVAVATAVASNEAYGHTATNFESEAEAFDHCHELVLAMQESKLQEYADSSAAAAALSRDLDNQTATYISTLVYQISCESSTALVDEEIYAGFRLDSPFYEEAVFETAAPSDGCDHVDADEVDASHGTIDSGSCVLDANAVSVVDSGKAASYHAGSVLDAVNASRVAALGRSRGVKCLIDAEADELAKYETVADKYSYQGKMRLCELKNDVKRKLTFRFGDDDLIINSTPLVLDESFDAWNFRQADIDSSFAHDESSANEPHATNCLTLQAAGYSQDEIDNLWRLTHHEVLLPFDVAVLSQQFSSKAFGLIKDKTDPHGLSMIYRALRAEHMLKRRTVQEADLAVDGKAVVKSLAAVCAGADSVAFPAMCFSNLDELAHFITLVGSTAVRLSPEVFDKLFEHISSLNFTATHLTYRKQDEYSILIFDEHIEIVRGRYHNTDEKHYLCCLKGRYRGVAYTYQSNRITPIHVLLAKLRPTQSNSNSYFINLIDDAYSVDELKESFGNQLNDAFIPFKMADSEAFKQVAMAADAASSTDASTNARTSVRTNSCATTSTNVRPSIRVLAKHQQANPSMAELTESTSRAAAVRSTTSAKAIDATSSSKGCNASREAKVGQALTAICAYAPAASNKAKFGDKSASRTSRPACSMSFSTNKRGRDESKGYVTVVSEKEASIHETYAAYSYKSCSLETQLYTEAHHEVPSIQTNYVLCLEDDNNIPANTLAKSRAKTAAKAAANKAAATTLTNGCAGAAMSSTLRMYELPDLALSAQFIANDMNYSRGAYGAMLCAPNFIASQGSLELCMGSQPMNNLLECFASSKQNTKSKGFLKSQNPHETKLSLQNLNGRLFNAANAHKMYFHEANTFSESSYTSYVDTTSGQTHSAVCVNLDATALQEFESSMHSATVQTQAFNHALANASQVLSSTAISSIEAASTSLFEDYESCADAYAHAGCTHVDNTKVECTRAHTVYRYHEDPVDYAWSAPSPDFTSIDKMVDCKTALAAATEAEIASAAETAKAHAAHAKTKLNCANKRSSANTSSTSAKSCHADIYGACACASNHADSISTRTLENTDFIDDKSDEESVITPGWEKTLYAAETKALAIEMYVQQLNESEISRKAQATKSSRTRRTSKADAIPEASANEMSIVVDNSYSVLALPEAEPVTINDENVFFESVQMDDFSVVVTLTESQIKEQATQSKHMTTDNAYRSKVFSSNSLEALSSSSDNRKRGSNNNGKTSCSKTAKNAITRAYPFSVKIEGEDDLYAVEQKNTIYREHDDGVHITLADLVTASTDNARGKLYHKLLKHAEDNSTSFLDGLGRDHNSKTGSSASKSDMNATEFGFAVAKAGVAVSCAAKSNSKMAMDIVPRISKEELERLSNMCFYDDTKQVYQGPSILSVEFEELKIKPAPKLRAINMEKRTAAQRITDKVRMPLSENPHLAILGNYRLTFNYSLRSSIPDIATFNHSQESVQHVLVHHSDTHGMRRHSSYNLADSIAQTITKKLSALCLDADTVDYTQLPTLAITDVPQAEISLDSASRSLPVQDAVFADATVIALDNGSVAVAEAYETKTAAIKPHSTKTAKTVSSKCKSATSKVMSLETLAGLPRPKPVASKIKSKRAQSKTKAKPRTITQYSMDDPRAYTSWLHFDEARAERRIECENARHNVNASTARAMSSPSSELIDTEIKPPMIFNLEKLDLTKLKRPSHSDKPKEDIVKRKCMPISGKSKRSRKKAIATATASIA